MSAPPPPATATAAATGPNPDGPSTGVSAALARPPLVVLYGSQTGCAQEVAERVAREGRAIGMRVQLASMDAFDKRLLPTTPLVVFVASTTGQGDVADNARTLYRFLLRRDLPADALAAMRFGVFGLGDSSYPLFNAVARRLHQRLVELGGQPLLNRGLADDQADRGVDEALDPWLKELWATVQTMHPTLLAARPTSGASAPKYRLDIVRADSSSIPSSVVTTASSGRPVLVPPMTLPPFQAGTAQAYTPVPLRLVVNRRITPATHFQDVRHLEFELPSSAVAAAAPSSAPALPSGPGRAAQAPKPFMHEPGDVLYVHPRNVLDATTIEWLERTYHFEYARDACTIDRARRTDADADAEDEDDSTRYLPAACTIRDLFELHLDVLGTPRRYFFEQLGRFATTDLERERLADFCDPTQYPDFARYCVREKRTYLEVLQDFPHSTPPLAALLDMVPRLQPRQFSIASSRALHPDRVHLLLAVLDITTPFKRRRTGVASAFLASLDPEAGEVFVSCWVKTTPPGALAFRAPPPTNQLVCFGPGTGVAPFRAMVQARAAMQREREEVMYELEPETDGLPRAELEPWPPVLLFFGARNRQADFFYETEWPQYERDHVLQLETAFSRDVADQDGDASEERVRYVQHALLRRPDRAKQVTRLMLQGGTVFVAGSANAMPRDVRRALADALITHGPQLTHDEWNEDRAQQHLKLMDKQRRYMVEAY